jgi:hypothetical protein
VKTGGVLAFSGNGSFSLMADQNRLLWKSQAVLLAKTGNADRQSGQGNDRAKLINVAKQAS